MGDLANDMLLWYDKNHRDLPWRHSKNPYTIWIFGDHAATDPCRSRKRLLCTFFRTPAGCTGISRG